MERLANWTRGLTAAVAFAAVLSFALFSASDFPGLRFAFGRASLRFGQAPSISITPVAAAAAETFVQSIGVNLHMAYTSTTYSNVNLVESDLAYLAIDHVRDKLEDAAYVNIANYRQLAASGVKFDFIIPVYSPSTVDLTEFISMLNAFVQAHPGSVSAIEGPNEVNEWPAAYDGGTTLADQAALQRALYAAVRAAPNLNGIAIYNITLAGTDGTLFEALGDLSASANYANSHAYLYAAQAPAVSLTHTLPYAQIDAPGLPIVITETGYETNPADTYSGVDYTVQAKLTLDELMDAFKEGVSQTYLYELFDEGGQNFGLFNAEGAPKLAATAIHNLTTILSDPGYAISFTPGSFAYAVADMPNNANRFLLEKSNGTFDLVLWAEPPIWNSSTKDEIAALSENTTINFTATQKTVLVFDPLLGSVPIAAYQNVQSIRVTLTDHPIIVEIPRTAATPSSRQPRDSK